MNALHPDRMTAAERLAEIGRILAMGFLRGRDRMGPRAPRDDSPNGDVSLDLAVERSGHGSTRNARGEPP